MRLFGQDGRDRGGRAGGSQPGRAGAAVQIQSDALATALTLAAIRLLIAGGAIAGGRAGPAGRAAVRARLPGAATGRGDRGGAGGRAAVVWRRTRLARRLMLGAGGRAGCDRWCRSTLYSLSRRGRLSYSGKGYLYGVVSDADIMENGYAIEPLSPAGVHPSRSVVRPRARSGPSYALLPLALLRAGVAGAAGRSGWPGAVLALVRGWYPWTARWCWWRRPRTSSSTA